jgi:hypothetical protein
VPAAEAAVLTPAASLWKNIPGFRAGPVA